MSSSVQHGIHRKHISLPEIHNKPINFHSIRPLPKRLIDPQYDNIPKFDKLQCWAHIPSPKFNKKHLRHYRFPQYPSNNDDSYFYQQKRFNNQVIDPSMTILQKYFSRKLEFRLKNVIKTVDNSPIKNNGSIPFQTITIYKNKFKSRSRAQDTQTLSFQSQLSSQKSQIIKNAEKTLKRKRSNKSLQKSIQHLKSKSSIIDNYFDQNI